MSLTPADVEKVALLARLQLSPSEVQTMTSQLGRVLAYVDQLGELDDELAGIEPMAHAIDVANVFADDTGPDGQSQPSFPRDEMLANAPKRDDECYRVPAVLGE